MQKVFNTSNFKETQELGKILASEITPGALICLSGDLGSGKTTFTQGLLKGLNVTGPFTSPTFLIIKNYQKEIPISKSQFPNKSKIKKYKIRNIYHVDAYRVTSRDILNLGWKEMVAEKNNIIIIEWANRIRKIIPRGALWIKFEWLDQNKRKITFK
ncbi:MAG: tRNA (adenosine(37)-N6)-threonylcarbamoyltransferase complex ATPase subunit type 1 TsaE [Candidatus Moranbacteria bacterium CG_4_9_14_3_um_filter_42_9]|nr:MAG: tRNA (adenosine(37)-N6)-threonylcarbamoyltransferase complex ATPase subunit type 1 TsaE [Candidatus Moranbacteria bacterium CG_4_9_14_3_um_filter_42_9]